MCVLDRAGLVLWVSIILDLVQICGLLAGLASKKMDSGYLRDCVPQVPIRRVSPALRRCRAGATRQLSVVCRAGPGFHPSDAIVDGSVICRSGFSREAISGPPRFCGRGFSRDCCGEALRVGHRRQAGSYRGRRSVPPPQPMLRQLGVEPGAGNAQALGGQLAIAATGRQCRLQRLALGLRQLFGQGLRGACLLYTSDAADE